MTYPLPVAYDHDGQEDLDKTFRNAILNVRYFVEKENMDWRLAVDEVADIMYCSWPERQKLYDGAKKKYDGQS
ncbi:MAG: hypothetical protein VW496_02295 [Pelagibacteraceae bacterium]|jgi:hypothetical protein